jgi:aspartyl/glutamyl-tRNA(Asn/Gln) amidotransferase C subunit
MIVDETLVRRLEHLSALSLGADERAAVAADLTRFLGYVEELGDAPAALAEASEAADALSQPPLLPLRPDAPETFSGMAEAMAGAPELDGTAFLVPRFAP